MQLKVAITNIALSILLVFMVINVVGIWQKEAFFPEMIPSENGRSANDTPVAFSSQMPSENNYDSIVENNLFSENRMEYIPPETEDIVVDEKIQGKSVVLYGVVRSGGFVAALISNPEAKAGGKSSIWVKEGEQIANLKVVGIEEDSVVLNDGEKKYRVLLYQKEREQSNQRVSVSGAPTVITTSQPQKAVTESQEKTKNEALEDFIEVSTPFGMVKRRK